MTAGIYNPFREAFAERRVKFLIVHPQREIVYSLETKTESSCD